MSTILDVKTRLIILYIKDVLPNSILLIKDKDGQAYWKYLKYCAPYHLPKILQNYHREDTWEYIDCICVFGLDYKLYDWFIVLIFLYVMIFVYPIYVVIITYLHLY